MISAPLFGVELDSGDISLFEKLSDAESYIESYDIDTWRVFDSAGRLCQIEPAAKVPMVKISLASDGDLRSLLPIVQAFLNRQSSSGTKEKAALMRVLSAIE